MTILVDKQKRLDEKIRLASVDPVVYINTFFYTFDPRVTPPKLPFKLFDIQKELIKEIKNSITLGYDLFIDKSRDVGATYTTLATFLWFWNFVERSEERRVGKECRL